MASEVGKGSFLLSLGIGMLWCGLAAAETRPAASEPASASSDRPVCVAVRVVDPPVLDGRLDDPAWTNARPITRFVRQNGSASRFTTEFRFIYDREALYASVHAVEPNLPGLVLHPDKPDAVGNDDCVEFFVDADRTGRRYVQHIINAAGGRLSFFCTDVGMKSEVVSASGREKDAWTLEVRFPFSDLGGPPAPGDRWGLDLARNRVAKGTSSEGEYSFWSPGRVPYGTPAKFGALVFDLPGNETAFSGQLSDAATARLLQQIENELHRRTPWTDADVNDDARNERARRLLGLNKLVASFPEARLLCAVRPAISNEPVLPWSVPRPDEVSGEVRLTVCRGEFEPVSLQLLALRDLESVRLQVSECRGASGRVLPAGTVDPYYVPCWYQTGVCDNYNRQITLVNELLVKSPRLISVDLQKRKNTLNFDRIPEDAKDLQPFAIPAYESRQVWLRFHVPRDAGPGLYAGTIRIDDANGTCASVAVRLRVPAWDLVPSPLLHGLYYGRRLPAKLETVEQENAAFGMMEKEIQDQIEHGCNIIGSYVHPGPLPSDRSPFATLTRIDAIGKKYGITDTPYFCVVCGAGGQSGDALITLRKEARKLSAWAREHGRSGFVFQGRDEAPPEKQREELPAWEAVQQGGGMTFVAGGDIDVAGKLLDFPVVGGPYRSDYARRAHALGVRVLSYAYPFTGVEMPERHRRNYGLRLYAADYDGALNFCYGDTEENANAWNEFGDNNWRHTSYAYPSVTGPIDTLAFEGWREGIDDVRYAATLRKAIEDAMKSKRNADAAQASLAWLNSLTGDEPDLDAVRAEIVHRTDELIADTRTE